MRAEAYESRPPGALNRHEACALAGIHRVTLWKWITHDGLRYWRDPQYPHGYYYAPADLQAMKRLRGARKAVQPKRPPTAYDYD